MRMLSIVIAVMILTGCEGSKPEQYYYERGPEGYFPEKGEKPIKDSSLKEFHPHYTKDSRTGICYAWTGNFVIYNNIYNFSFTAVDCDKVKDYIGK